MPTPMRNSSCFRNRLTRLGLCLTSFTWKRLSGVVAVVGCNWPTLVEVKNDAVVLVATLVVVFVVSPALLPALACEIRVDEAGATTCVAVSWAGLPGGVVACAVLFGAVVLAAVLARGRVCGWVHSRRARSFYCWYSCHAVKRFIGGRQQCAVSLYHLLYAHGSLEHTEFVNVRQGVVGCCDSAAANAKVATKWCSRVNCCDRYVVDDSGKAAANSAAKKKINFGFSFCFFSFSLVLWCCCCTYATETMCQMCLYTNTLTPVDAGGEITSTAVCALRSTSSTSSIGELSEASK